MSKVRSLSLVLFLVLFLLSSIPAAPSLAAPTNTCISDITRVSLPSPSAGTVSIDGIAAAAPNDVWAVGFSAADLFSPRESLIEHWNGTAWSIVPSAELESESSWLQDVAVISPSDVWAVGSSKQSDTTSGTLIQHWNGTMWSLVPSPNGPLANNSLVSVSGAAANDVWAVGSAFQESSLPTASLILHWNGTDWQIVSSPTNGAFIRVVAKATNDVWALAHASDWGPNFYSRAQLLHWDGAAWSLVTEFDLSASESDGTESVTDMLAWADDDIWVTGTFHLGHSFQGRTWHWGGTRWAQVDGNPAPIKSLAGTRPKIMWNVGAVYLDAGTQTFFARWNGTDWSYSNLFDTIGDFDPTKIAAVSGTEFWIASLASTNPSMLHGTMTCTKLPRPTLLIPGPKDEVNMRKPYFEWSSSEEDAFYLLQLRYKNKNGLIVDTLEAGTTEHIRWNKILPTGQYYWRVKACNVFDGCSKWSKGRKFYLDKN